MTQPLRFIITGLVSVGFGLLQRFKLNFHYISRYIFFLTVAIIYCVYKTKMAKSVLDADWSMLKIQLKYKAIARSVVFEVVNEAYSTQGCSCCGCISANCPKGRADLEIREWVCYECGTTHDRDINAAKNILVAGHCRLAVGIPVL